MFDLDAFLADCREAARMSVPTPAVRDLLDRALRDRRAVADAFGRHTRAHLDVLHADDEFVVLNAVWAPAMHFPPHDHRTWAVIGIYGGDEDNAFYKRDRESLVAAGGRSIREGEAVVLGPEVIHAVTNPRTQSFTGAIHVYGGPYLTAARSMWHEPELVEGPTSIAASQAIFDAANAALEKR